MKGYLRGIIDIRKGEVAVTLLLLANIYILLVTYYFIKPLSRSLFLANVGADEIPLVFILIAIVIVPVTTLYSQAGRRFKLPHLIIGTLFVFIVSVFVLRWLVTRELSWVPWAYYIWASIFGVLVTSQFWLMANAVYDAAQAKRLFVLLALGAIFGGATGGEVTGILTDKLKVSKPDLLYFCAGLLVISAVITMVTWALKKREMEQAPRISSGKGEKRESIVQMFGSIKRSRHLLLIVGIMTIMMMVASFVEYQFQTVAANHFTDAATGVVDEPGLRAFMGRFYGRLSLVSLLLQIVFTYRFLRVLGVGGVILFLPIGLLLGSFALVLNLSLLTAVLLRGTDGSLKYSVDKTGRELLFLPVPLELKKKTKVFIDMFIDRWARGVSGALVIGLCLLFSYERDSLEAVRLVGYVVLGFVALWVFLALLMRREYVNTFRKAIEKREIDFSEIRVRINEQATIATLAKSLQSPNEREVEYALGMLTEVQNVNLLEPLRPLLKHPSATIRKKTIKVLQAQSDGSLAGDVKELLDDSSIEVSREAMNFLIRSDESGGRQMLNVFLTHPQPRYRYLALATIARHGTSKEKQLIDEQTVQSLVNLPGDEGVEARQVIAEALGYLGDFRFHKYFKRFLNDPNALVVARAILSIGRLKEREHVPWLINALGDKVQRPEARTALAAFGPAVLGTLLDYLTDERTPQSVRRNIPRVLSQIPVQDTVDALATTIKRVEPNLKFYVVKALNRLRTDHPELKFAKTPINEALMAETRSYYEILHLIEYHGRSDDDGAKLLARALRERLDQNLERIFRLLGLSYPPNDIYSAYQGVVSKKHEIRGSAIEFLDNLLKSNVKRYLLPILDETSTQRMLRKGQELFGIAISSYEEALVFLINGRDSWLKACAIFSARSDLSPAVREAVALATRDNDPVVREAAEAVLSSPGG